MASPGNALSAIAELAKFSHQYFKSRHSKRIFTLDLVKAFDGVDHPTGSILGRRGSKSILDKNEAILHNEQDFLRTGLVAGDKHNATDKTPEFFSRKCMGTKTYSTHKLPI